MTNLADAWMQTHSGLRVRPYAIKPEDVSIMDIAHSLAHICRFNGHCAAFYSVAEHSIRVARCFTRPNFALAALLHDAEEAYIGDRIRPLCTPSFRGVKDVIRDVIFDALNVAPGLMDEVERVDNGILILEANILMGNTDGWEFSDLWSTYALKPPTQEEFNASLELMTPSVAKDNFLYCYRAINDAIQEGRPTWTV